MTIPCETTDRRVNAATEFLSGSRRRKLDQMRPSELTHECAELRKLLGQALDVLAERREVLGQVLADAISYRTPEGFCRDCEDHPAALCSDHAADLDRTPAGIHCLARLSRRLSAAAPGDRGAPAAAVRNPVRTPGPHRGGAVTIAITAVVVA